MGCKASTIREAPVAPKANANNFAPSCGTNNVVVSPIEEIAPIVAPLQSPKKKNSDAIEDDATPKAEIVVAPIVAAPENEPSSPAEPMEPVASPVDAVEIVTTPSTLIIASANEQSTIPVMEEKIASEPAAAAAASESAEKTPVKHTPSKCHGSSKKIREEATAALKVVTNNDDMENAAPMAASKKLATEITTPKRAFGAALLNTNHTTPNPIPAHEELSAKKAVTFTSTTKSFEKKTTQPLVSRSTKKSAGLRKGHSGKANMNMDVYLQQCAAFERLLTNVNTFEKQMNSR